MKEKILFIHPRKGLFRVTKCNDCGHVFQCEQCDANLITYRSTESQLMMICHQCQTHYNYPNKCQECGHEDISSIVGGADELENELKDIFAVTPTRFDQSDTPKSTRNPASIDADIAITTRIYDPLIPYSRYNLVVFVHAENLFASPDYQVLEESMRQIAQLFQELSAETEVFFDTKVVNSSLFGTLSELNQAGNVNDLTWYTDFLNEEGHNREQFEFPPFHNIILITTQDKNKNKSFEIIDNVHRELEKIAEQLPNLSVTAPYQARFLKRKGMYSYHTLIRYPKKYQHFVPLRKAISEIGDRFFVQIRLNPRHLF